MIRRSGCGAALLGLLLCSFGAGAQDEAGDPVPPKVMAVYEAGKAAYDAKDFTRALEQFDRCVELEPARARWHYNRGLALKKLKRSAESIEAFLDSRRMDAAYKRPEIDQKLAELGYRAPAEEGSPGPAAPNRDAEASLPLFERLPRQTLEGVMCAGIAGLLALLARWLQQKAKKSAEPVPLARTGPSKQARQAELETALAELAARQAPLEHALAPDDDPQGHALVEQAGHELQFARFLWKGGDLAAREATVGRARAAVDAARKHFEGKGQGWDAARGERVGCFFCSRPLAAKSARRGVDLTTATGRFAVVACEHCAKKVTSGAKATVRMVGPGPQQLHWAQEPSFDPYLHGHWGGPPSLDVEAWRVNLSGEQLSSLAPLVGLAAVGGAAAVVGAFDLFGAREAGLAADAATAAAAAAAGSVGASSSRQWNDHS